MEDLLDKYCESFLAKQLLLVDEVFWKSLTHKDVNKVKNYVTGKTIKLEEKFGQRHPVPNTLHLICITNAEQPCPLENTKARRYFPLLADVSNQLDSASVSERTVLKKHTDAVISCLDNHWKIMGRLLYAWPIHMLDNFNAGHGVKNDHLGILQAATKKFTEKNNPVCKWWFTIMDKSSTLSGYLDPKTNNIKPVNNDQIRSNNGEHETFCSLTRDKLEDTMKWLIQGHPDLAPLKDAMDDVMKYTKTFEEHDRITMNMLKEIFVKYKVDDLLSNFNRYIETDQQTMERVLKAANGGNDQDHISKQVNQYLSTKNIKYKASKKDLWQWFQNWLTENPHCNDTGTMHTNEELIVYTIRHYVPWIQHILDKRYVLIGDVESCRASLQAHFDVPSNLPTSNRHWTEIIEEVFLGEPEHRNDEFHNKFQNDDAFEFKDEQWFMKLFLWVDDEQFMLPIRMILTEEQKESLLNDKGIDFNTFLFSFAEKLDEDDRLYKKCIDEYMQRNQYSNTEERTLFAHRVFTWMNKTDVSQLTFPDPSNVEVEMNSEFLLPNVRVDSLWYTPVKGHIIHTAYRIKVRNGRSMQRVVSMRETEELRRSGSQQQKSGEEILQLSGPGLQGEEQIQMEDGEHSASAETFEDDDPESDELISRRKQPLSRKRKRIDDKPFYSCSPDLFD